LIPGGQILDNLPVDGRFLLYMAKFIKSMQQALSMDWSACSTIFMMRSSEIDNQLISFWVFGAHPPGTNTFFLLFLFPDDQ
jgi:hypothetical protein